MGNFIFCAVVFGYFAAKFSEKTIFISYMVAKAICLEFYRDDTSTSAIASSSRVYIASSSRVYILWNFD